MLSETTIEEERSFSVHTNIIWDLIFKQHHRVDSALSELIQNAYDAGAKNVWITLTNQGFECKDDGKGFGTKSEVTGWFEVFGAPRDHESDTKFGRFRMGRGQIMGLASTCWRSGNFKMTVDPKIKGLNYTLLSGMPEHKGCTISGQWYESLDLEKPLYGENTVFEGLCKSLQKSIRYIFEMDVYINGKLVSVSSEEIEWTIETEDFYFLRIELPGFCQHQHKSVAVYNLGIFLDEFKDMRDNGIVVTKKHLKLNITRSKVQPDCPVMASIRSHLVKRKHQFSLTKKHSVLEANGILQGYCNKEYTLNEIQDVKLFSDLHNRKIISLDELSFTPFTIPPLKQRSEADLIDQVGKYFVVNTECLPIVYDDETNDLIMPLFERIFETDYVFKDSLSENYYCFESILSTIDTKQVILTHDQLSKDEQQILQAINRIRLRPRRKCFIGISSDSDGWTDGHSYIGIDRNWLKRQRSGLEMAMSLAQLLIHEYSHVAGETDVHDGSFYKRFHDKMENLHFYLTAEFLRNYDNILAKDKIKTTLRVKNAIKAVRRGGKSKIESI